MKLPTTGSQRQQFLCALQWVNTTTPNFTALVEPLHHFMKTVYDRANARTKRVVSKILQSALGWGKRETTSFHRSRTALAHRVSLAHRYKYALLCVYRDASDPFWSGILAQISQADVTRPYTEQRHQPFAFFYGSPTRRRSGGHYLRWKYFP